MTKHSIVRSATRGLPVLIIAALLSVAAEPTVATSQPVAAVEVPATARPPRVAAVDVLPTVRLDAGGIAVVARVRTLCQPNGILWEGFINITQGDLQVLAGLPLICDGRHHLTQVEIRIGDPNTATLFVRGEATVGAVIMDEDTLTPYATEIQRVKVR